MKNIAIYTLNIKISSAETLTMELNQEQSDFYLGRLPVLCSRNNLFNVLELVKKNRPQNEIDFFEKIALQTKNEEYYIDIKPIETNNTKQSNEIFKDMSITPDKERFLVLVCYQGTIISPAHFCGKHFHHLRDNAIRKSSIHKWAYQDDVFKQLGITPMEPEQLKQVHKKVTEEVRAENRSGPGIKVLEVIVEVLKEAAENQPKRPFH